MSAMPPIATELMRRLLVLQDLAKIAHIGLATADGALNEVLPLVLRFAPE